MEKSKPLYQNKKWLEYQYITLDKSSVQISKECNCCDTTISNWLKI